MILWDKKSLYELTSDELWSATPRVCLFYLLVVVLSFLDFGATCKYGVHFPRLGKLRMGVKCPSSEYVDPTKRTKCDNAIFLPMHSMQGLRVSLPVAQSNQPI